MSKDPFRYFRIEARELVDQLQRGIIALGEPRDPAHVRALMRASHTLKGAAGVVRQAEIALLAHDLEDKLAAGAQVGELLPLLDAVERQLATLGAPAQAPPTANAPVVSESVRLDLAEVDDLLASLSELGARIATMRGKSGAELTATIDRVERVAREALEDARRLRLLPAETLFAEVARAAHDAAARAGRLVELTTSGGDKRIDAQVLGVVRDALLQLVRNAIAHGIESPAERAAAGKPRTGQIAIRVEIRGPRAIIACRDDGAGLDLDAFRAKLGTTAKDLDATALVAAAMHTGLTTRATASELAGRGIGLQVVGAAIARLRGNLNVETTRGAGTEIVLDVPISITAAPALVVLSNQHAVTIPLDAVVRTLRIVEVRRTPEGDVLVDGDEAFRFASLSRVLGGPDSESRTAIIIGTSAIGVERVLGIANEVVHPLPAHAVASDLVTGASLDGDGNPRLSLDPRLLAARVRTLGSAPAKPVERAKPRVLVCDDSLTSRMLEQSILEAAGYEVMTATSGEDALAKARRHEFVLFVVDVEMPGMTGFETVARMRADPSLSAVPAVLVTSRGAPEDRQRGLEAGARAYIVKGEFAQTEFLDTVRRLIG